jgi:hypothetical protein
MHDGIRAFLTSLASGRLARNGDTIALADLLSSPELDELSQSADDWLGLHPDAPPESSSTLQEPDGRTQFSWP